MRDNMFKADAAFLKLQISRENLVRWLDSPAPLASNWQDWRNMSDQWPFKDGLRSTADMSEAELQENIAQCDPRLSQRTNRQVLHDILKSAEAPFLKHATYDAKTSEFIAGALTYSENLPDAIVFLTLARGAAKYLGPDGYGIAVIHNYIWGDKGNKITRAAIRLGPGARSEFMTAAEKASAGGAFQALAMDMLNKNQSASVDELESLR
jgi:hypothetical protein